MKTQPRRTSALRTLLAASAAGLLLLSGCAESDKALSTSSTLEDSNSDSTSLTDSSSLILAPFEAPEKSVDIDLSIFPESNGLETPDHIFDVTYEWEDAQLEGGTAILTEQEGYSGSGYVGSFQEEEAGAVLTVTVPATTYYDLTLTSAAIGGEKYNFLLINDRDTAEIHTTSEQWQSTVIHRIKLHRGDNTIAIQRSWGWFNVDTLRVRTSDYEGNALYEVSAQPVSSNAGEPARRLMRFLSDVYGYYTISGQYASIGGKNSVETRIIKEITGKYPALLGFDFGNDTPTHLGPSVRESSAVKQAIDWWNEGGIVTFCWHWYVPKDINDFSKGRAFYSSDTPFDVEQAITPGTKENEIILHHIDEIARHLKTLQEAGVPVLWRPLHEASGGWFWWGAKGPEPYLSLYRLLFERLTEYHGLDNLIWIWNGQDPAWYPGDDYVDIIGKDIYPEEGDYSSQYMYFNHAAEVPTSHKIVAMTENSCIPGYTAMLSDNARWSFFCTWSGDFVFDSSTGQYNETYNSAEHLKEVYNNDRILTLDEIPDLTSYPLE